MADTRYGQYVKELEFKNYGKGGYRQGAEINCSSLGLDVHVSLGTCYTAGRMGKEPYGPHVHDFDQVLVWMGTDTGDLSELGAEVELWLGEEMEKHMITNSRAVVIPKGMPHFPATVTRLDKRFIFMAVSCAPEYQATPFATDRKPATEVSGFRGSKYRKYILPLYFTRKGAWWYGPENRDDSGGSITNIRTDDLGFKCVILYESIKKAPYRFNPVPDKPHVHPHRQCMLFLGTDPDDLSVLGAEVEMCLGNEEERHIITRPSAVITPADLPHWPGGTIELSKPIIMVDIHPYGT